MKGLSVVVASVILVVITVTIATTIYLYISGIIKGKTSVSFSIVDMNDNILIIHNTGFRNITSVEVFIDGKKVNTVIEGNYIEPTKSGAVKIDMSGIKEGTHRLIVISGGYSESLNFISGPTTSTSTPSITTSSTTTSTPSITTSSTTTSIALVCCCNCSKCDTCFSGRCGWTYNCSFGIECNLCIISPE